ncbi:MAG TPA: Ig-like domain-containing protein, partial [Bacteroidales bacterium]|nr:Ig-like domain-containing protein [Bacteroidales bacterium]
MKQNQIFACLLVFLLVGVLLTGCDDNMPEVTEVGVESVTLNEELSNGVTMEIGTTTNIAWKVTLTPENATDRAQTFSSSDVNVATVNAKGQLTANAQGTSEISISVGGKSVAFTLTVVGKSVIPATAIKLTVSGLELMVGVNYNLFEKVTVEPADASDGLTYTSSAPEVVSVNDNGVLAGVSPGTAVITVASRHDAAVNATLPVTVIPFTSDYSRTGWTMTASHPLFKTTADAEKNSLAAALDNDFSTNFCLVRPGKGIGNNPRVDVPTGDAIYFIVDMQKSQAVNYFRIRHRDVTQAFIRLYAFDEILGSNDGTTFTVIASNVAITDAGIAAQQESPNIAIPKSTYRYLKFYSKNASCFYQSSFTSQGSSIQIQELYLGLTP